MSQHFKKIGPALKRLFLATSLVFVTFSVPGQMVKPVPVNIFGDGIPENGIEDGREPVMGGSQGAVHHRNAGTILCDGKVRGTAMVVDTREFVTGFNGVVLASAAHVIYDLDRKRRFRRCEFHFMALSDLPGYRAKIDLKNVRLGAYDPLEATDSFEFGEGDWAFLYVPQQWKNFDPDETISPREFSFVLKEPFEQSGGEFRLIAFDSSESVISVSRNCKAIESGGGDLGGGSWEGQLLDDCDSADGASGGGIVAVLNGRQFLIGIRSGSHWSEQVFPKSEYPQGPIDGSVWDQNSNTNFGRAVDASLLNHLMAFILALSEDKSLL